MADQTMTIAELQDLPTVTDIPTAARALGLGRTVAYALAQSGNFPCRVLRIGGSYRVPTADLIHLLDLHGRDTRSSDPFSVLCGEPRVERPQHTALRPTPDTIGRLYLMKFDNGVIKAGSTTDPAARRKKLVRDAGRYDLTVVKQWYSKPVKNTPDLERRLLAILDLLGTRTRAGREYFRNVAFSIACYQADNLDHVQSRECCCGKCVAPVNIHTSITVAGDLSGGIDPPGAVAVDVRLSCGDVIRASFCYAELGPDGRDSLRPGNEVAVDLDPRPTGGVWTARIESIPSRGDCQP